MRKIKSKLYIIPMIIVFIFLIITYYKNYDNTIKIIKSEYDTKIELIEESIYNETKYTEILSKIAEKDIHTNMEKNSNVLVERYKEDPNILEWDFKEIRDQSEQMEIYILDEGLNIVASSSEDEIGLNFDNYPDFLELLKKRLKGNTFESDEINFSIEDNELKKFSYMPTPDNKYLIEFSVTINEMYPELKNLNIVYLAESLKDKYRFVEDIRVYRFNKGKEFSHELDTKKKASEGSINSKEDRDKYVKKALETDKFQEQIVKDDSGNEYRLKYIPYTVYYENNKLTWWKSYVIEVLYNDEVFLDKMSYQKKLFLQNIISISILYSGFSFMLISWIEQNRKTSYQDHLTKLPNRKRLEEVMEYKILESNKEKVKFIILFFDLDKFKIINDSLGHNVGDKVLQEVGKRIKREIRKEDIVSRVGGDEFIALISKITSQEEVLDIANRMLEAFKPVFKIDSKEISLDISIGISIYPDHGDGIEELILKADKAMYKAKKAKLGYKVYENKCV